MDTITKTEIQELWDATPEMQKERYLARYPEGPGYCERVYHHDEGRIKTELQAMACSYFCEQGDEYDSYAWEGVGSDAAAIDKLLEPQDKYGTWCVFRYLNDKWEAATLKRQPDNSVRLWWVDADF